ncbi:MAG TPA: hypothetical protein EYP17_12730, partial [Candidatus Latescibacteria bacterium]|nr:hypothetical protein [Candidatus Latescibacterota bacterium]
MRDLVPLFSLLCLCCGAHELREYKGCKLTPVTEFPESSIKGPQYIDINKYRLKVVGLVERPREFTYGELKRFPCHRKVVTLYCVEGWSVTALWEGLLLEDLLSEVGVEEDAKVAIFYAHDGYYTSLPLKDLYERKAILAYKVNGVPLPPEQGFPLQLVVEGKYGYKWIKWIIRIEISDEEDFMGYWEMRGFPNDGEVGSPHPPWPPE